MGEGSMIICEKSLNLVVHRIDTTGFPSCDMVMVSILDSRVCRDRVFFVSVYKPPNVNFKLSHWCEFFKIIKSITSSAQTFILGDLNAQNNIWGSTINNPSGISLGRFLLESFFYFLNDGKGTRVSASGNYKSVPDLSLTNARTLKVEWGLDEDPRGSDHLSIIIRIFTRRYGHQKIKDTQCTRTRQKLLLGNFDIKNFPVVLQRRFKASPVNLEDNDLLMHWYNLTIESILSGAIFLDGKGGKKYAVNNSVITVRSNKLKSFKKHSHNPWWDDDCSESIKKRKLSYKRFIQNPSRTNLLDYKRIFQHKKRRERT